jgi:hypothetical protein
MGQTGRKPLFRRSQNDSHLNLVRPYHLGGQRSRTRAAILLNLPLQSCQVYLERHWCSPHPNRGNLHVEE